MFRVSHRFWRRPPLVVLAGCALAAGVTTAVAIVNSSFELGQVALVDTPNAAHVDQEELLELVVAGNDEEAFTEAFEEGDELFETAFNALDGGGANVGRGQRYTRIPRADLKGTGEWFRHNPPRVTGPNAAACNECHELPFDDGAGTPNSNVHRDPFRTANIGQFVQRNTPHVFAPGAIQRLAEEMTDRLHQQRQALVNAACQNGGTWQIALNAKGVSYGALRATRTGSNPCTVSFDTNSVRGIDFQGSVDNPSAPPDLIVRPFQWKGSVPFIRDFNRGASHNELGMQAVEVAGDNVDGDGDGVQNEMTVGDQTALAIYLAAQPRPTTLLELNSLGLLDPALTSTQISRINRGRVVFDEVGCDSCHIPTLTIDNPTFTEPSQNAAYRDGAAFPAGQNPIARGVDPAHPVKFNLTRDQPDNQIERPDGTIFRLGSLRRDSSGRAIVELYGDLKRHVMGPRLAESVNEIAGDDVTPIPTNPRNRHTPDTFLTENLWGVGSTAPYMHDGRATTLAEAILEHSTSSSTDPSEARAARSAYLARTTADKQALIAFLENLVLFKVEEEEAANATAFFGGSRKVVTIKPKGFNIKLPEN
jgi:hypothetical protein